MPPLTDPDELLAIADRITGHAGAARERADRLARAVAAVAWHGPAAALFHESADVVLGGLRTSAARLEDAAHALRVHARRVAGVLAALRRAAEDLDVLGDAHALLRGAGAVAGDTRGLAGDTVGLLGDAVRALGW